MKSIFEMFYLHSAFSWFLIVLEIHSVITVLQLVFSHPLRILIISSLCCYTCYFDILTSQINLQPLVYVIWSGWPAPSFTSCLFKVQPSLYCGMIAVPLWGCLDSCVGNCSAFHAESFIASWKYKIVIVLFLECSMHDFFINGAYSPTCVLYTIDIDWKWLPMCP